MNRAVFTRLLPSGGAAACLLIGCAALLAVGGCPPTGGDGGGGVKDDPLIRPTPTEFTVEITSTQGILQFNALGLDALFQRSSTLGTNVTGPGLPDAGFTVVWTIQAPSGGASVLAFGAGAGAPTQTTTGASTEVTVVSDPGANDVDQVVSATVTLLDSGTVLPTETLTIKIVPDTGADTTVLESNPFATPSVGLDGNSQVVLDAGVTGNSGAFAVNWESISTLPAGIVLPNPATGDTLALDVTPPVGGVFSFRCTVTDSSESVAVGVVNVFLGQAALMLDVAVTRLHVSPTASAIDIRTTRVGGSDDQDDSTNGPFSYSFQILDDDDQDVTSSAAITPDPSASDNDAVNDWTISGLTTPGQYRIRVTVTDGAELLTGSGSVTVALGDGLSLALEPQFDRVGAGTGFSIRTVRGGGESSFTYSFEPIDSAGAAATTTFTPPSGSVDNDAVNNWALTGFATADTYRIFATVRDATGNSVTASTEVIVGDVFTLNVRSSDIVLAPGDLATLTFDGTGGTGAFSYAFAEASPGADSGSFGSASPLSVAGDGTVTWTAPSAPGAGAVEGVYVIDVIVTDARGLSAADSIAILVQEDEPLSLDVRSTANIVVPGGSVTLTFDQTGGESTYSYAFSTSGPNAGSSFGNASPKAAVADTTTTWTAPAASGTTEGTYRVDVEVTDALGNTARDSVVLIVQAAAALSLDVTSNIYTVAPGAAINLNFNQTGGVTTFTYTYDAFDPSGAGGAGTFGTGSPQTVANDLAETWTAPAPGAGVEGTYRFDVQVRDALLNTFQDSIFVLVQAAAPLSLDVTSNIYTVVPGGAINLNFNQTGGVTTFTYTYDAFDPSGAGGAGVFGTASGQTVAGDATSTWTAPAPGAGVEGTYRFDVQVRDALLNTFQDSIFVLVQAAAPLSLDVTSNIYTVVPGGAINLNFNRTGGVANFTYTYDAIDPAGGGGAGTFGTGSPQTVADDLAETWTAPPAAAGVEGTYRFDVEVSDALLNTFQDSIFVQVRSANRLSLDTTLRNYVVAPGMPIRVTGTATGGEPNYDFSFAALDPQGAAAGTFLNANPAASTALTQTSAYLPETTPATYRISSSVTDGTGDQIDHTTHLLVTEDTSVVNADIFVNPAANSTTSLLASQNIAADPRMVLDAGDLLVQTLPDPRNVVFVITDAAGGDLTVSSIRITGTNARGDTIQEEITTVNTNGTATSGLWPFKTISNIVLDYTSADAGNDTIEIGVGDRFGLSGKFQETSSTDAFHIVVNQATTAIDENATFLDPTNAGDIVIVGTDNLAVPTTAQQYVQLIDTAPNADIDYGIQIGPELPLIALNVVASNHTLDVSAGDTAELTLQVTGGEPPYTFTYDGEGFTNAADSFLPVSGQTTGGDASTLWTPDVGVPGSENHVIWVRVSDSAGNVATDSVIINVVP